MNIFERYLTLWVALCIVAGIALGHLMPGAFAGAEVAKVNMPVAILIWLMIIPMLLKIDFGALREVCAPLIASPTPCFQAQKKRARARV